VTIHSTHPFVDPEPDPVRQWRGRLGGAVSLWTAGGSDGPAGWAGLTVSSVLVAAGEPTRVIGLVDPDSDLADTVEETGRAVVSLLSWEHRDLAEAFAGQAPAPGGPFRLATFERTPYGPGLVGATSRALVSVESSVEVGWSRQLTCIVDDLVVLDEDTALLHRRGRYAKP
jgi:flavin reductase (DIM6/NTAB) family NADH-FMN oxidoreductase RutF